MRGAANVVPVGGGTWILSNQSPCVNAVQNPYPCEEKVSHLGSTEHVAVAAAAVGLHTAPPAIDPLPTHVRTPVSWSWLVEECLEFLRRWVVDGGTRRKGGRDTGLGMVNR